MQQNNYNAAEIVYRKAQAIEPDANKACNLGLCLIKQGRYDDARYILDDVFNQSFLGNDDGRSAQRAQTLIQEIESRKLLSELNLNMNMNININEEFMNRLDLVMSEWAPFRSKRLPIFEEISSFRDQMAC